MCEQRPRLLDNIRWILPAALFLGTVVVNHPPGIAVVADMATLQMAPSTLSLASVPEALDGKQAENPREFTSDLGDDPIAALFNELPDEVQPKKKIATVFQSYSWQKISLDKDGLQVSALSEPLSLKESEGGLGAEAFVYQSFLLRQASEQLKLKEEQALSRVLKQLARSSDELGERVEQSGKLWFKGVPTDNMNHLVVRANLKSHLNELNTLPIHLVEQGNGFVSSVSDTFHDNQALEPMPGGALRRFNYLLTSLKALPSYEKYPEMMGLLEQQAVAAQSVALGLQLEWKNTFRCAENAYTQCRQTSTHAEIYTKQTEQLSLTMAVAPKPSVSDVAKG